MINKLLATFQREDSKYLISIQKAKNSNEELFNEIGDEIILSLLKTFPEMNLIDLVTTYSEYTMEQNLLQARYEISGKYPVKNHAEANELVYQKDDVMKKYMGALLLTQFLWPHHLEIVNYFKESFLTKIPDNSTKALELAPGHGFFGRILLKHSSYIKLTGIDISKEAINLAQRLSETESLEAEYLVADALADENHKYNYYDIIIAGEFLEHVENPQMVFHSVKSQLKNNNSVGFITAAITAANLDHVYEFKEPGEVTKMMNSCGLVLVDSLLVSPPTARAAKKIPRVLSMIVKKNG